MQTAKKSTPTLTTTFPFPCALLCLSPLSPTRSLSLQLASFSCVLIYCSICLVCCCCGCPFVELDEFNSTIATLVEVMDGQATKIERAKLKAIGQRNKVDSEEGNRKRKAEELRAQINEDLTDLERLRAEHDSLTAVELEQRGLIERLSNA